MPKAIEKKCEKCNRVLHRSFTELDGAEWEIKETIQTFRQLCWPCSCNNENEKYGEDSAKSRHSDILKFLVEKGCGC